MPAVVGIAVVVLLIILSASGAFGSSKSGGSKAKAGSPVKGTVQTAAGRRSTRKRKPAARFVAKN
jgi:hypothetical protein